MSQYIRASTKGGSYFFTVVAHDRRPIFCQPDFLQALKASIRQVQQKHPFQIIAWVQLPDHLHCIWQMPIGDANYSMRWSQIKRLTTQACPQYYLRIDELSYSRLKEMKKGFGNVDFLNMKLKVI